MKVHGWRRWIKVGAAPEWEHYETWCGRRVRTGDTSEARPTLWDPDGCECLRCLELMLAWVLRDLALKAETGGDVFEALEAERARRRPSQ